MQKYLDQTSNPEVKLWISSVLKNYLQKNEEKCGEIEHIIDYLNSDLAPSRLLKMSYAQAVKKAAQWIETLNKKSKEICETETDVEIIKEYDNNFKIVKLISKNAYDREGLLMRHCVSSYFGKNESIIYSLRDCENMPHCTFEILKKSNQIQQIKGKGNGSIHPNYISYILDFIKNIANYKIKESEMENLGYYYIDRSLSNLMKENFVDLSFLENEGRLFIYMGGKKYKRIPKKNGVL